MKNIFSKRGCATIVYDRIERKYLLGKDISDGVIGVIENQKFYFTDDRYFFAVKDAIIDLGFEPVRYTGPQSVNELLEKKKVSTVYLNYDKVCVSEYLRLKEQGFNTQDYSSEMSFMRAVKSKKELSQIKKACCIVQEAYYEVIKTVREGDTEREVKTRLENAMLKLGADGLAFDTIVAFGKNSAIPHHETGDDTLNKGQVILVDMGCTFDGYCSDITRTAFYGTPSQKFIDDYQAVLKANIESEREIIANTRTDFADGIARSVLKSYGIEDYFTHSLGHGIGLEVHEYPFLSQKRKDELVNGMVFSIEPGVYFNGEYGIRIEDTVAMIDGKVERFFTDDKKLIIL